VSSSGRLSRRGRAILLPRGVSATGHAAAGAVARKTGAAVAEGTETEHAAGGGVARGTAAAAAGTVVTGLATGSGMERESASAAARVVAIERAAEDGVETEGAAGATRGWQNAPHDPGVTTHDRERSEGGR
jgi:hypothetical protein